MVFKYIILLQLLVSCSIGKPMKSKNEISFEISDNECLSTEISEFTFIIKNNSTNRINVNENGFVLFGIKDKKGNVLQPKMIYDPLIEFNEDFKSIESGSVLKLKTLVNDLKYYELNVGEQYSFQFKYFDNDKKKSGFDANEINMMSGFITICE